LALFSLSLFTELSFHTAPVVRASRTSARIERISERVLVFQAREARFVPYERAFSSVYVLVLHIERMRLLETTTTTPPYVYAHIYEESTGDVARLRGGEKAERSEERALFKLLSGCFCFVFFSLVCCCCRSHLSLRSTTTPYVLHLCFWSRGFYRANKNSILSVKKHVLNTRTRTCVHCVRARIFIGSIS
jgi:hypothetical protein